jgi:hypothetical protein
VVKPVLQLYYMHGRFHKEKGHGFNLLCLFNLYQIHILKRKNSVMHMKYLTYLKLLYVASKSL